MLSICTFERRIIDFQKESRTMIEWNNTSIYCIENCTSSKETDIKYLHLREQTRFWFQRVLVPIITILGVTGNSITITIMSRRRMRSSTNYYLTFLAAVDMLYLIFSFTLSLSHYPNIHDVKYYVYWKLKPVLYMLTDTCSNTSVWLTVTFTVERYIAVCHPMKRKIFCTETKAKKAITGVFLLCFTLAFPTLFEHQVDDSKLTYIDLIPTDLGKNAFYQTVYYWLTTLLFIFLPFLLLAIFNSFLIYSLHSSKVRRKTMTRRKDTKESSFQERKITIMLISVVILFFICQIPTAFVLIYQTLNTVTPTSNAKTLLECLGNLFNFLVSVNAAGNFVLYCLLSQKFRKTFLQVFCSCFKGKVYNAQSIYQNTINTSIDQENIQMLQKSHGESYFIKQQKY